MLPGTVFCVNRRRIALILVATTATLPTLAGCQAVDSVVDYFGPRPENRLLALADAAVVLDIYGAREQPVEGITSRIITDKMPSDMQVIFEPDFSAAARDVVSLVEPGDVVLTIGAGSVTMVAAEILDELRAS